MSGLLFTLSKELGFFMVSSFSFMTCSSHVKIAAPPWAASFGPPTVVGNAGLSSEHSSCFARTTKPEPTTFLITAEEGLWDNYGIGPGAEQYAYKSPWPQCGMPFLLLL